MNSKFIQYAPQGIFENSKDGVIPIQSVFFTRTVAAATSLIPAVVGKRSRIVGGVFQSNATTSTGITIFYNASGAGTILFALGTPARDGSQGPFPLPISEFGYFETQTGDALFAEAAVVSQQGTLFYIQYTP